MNEKSDCFRLFPIKKKKNVFKFKNAQKKNEAGSDSETWTRELVLGSTQAFIYILFLASIYFNLPNNFK